MNISRTSGAFAPQRIQTQATLQPATEAELQQVDGFSQSQDRFLEPLEQVIGGVFGAGIGAIGGSIGGATIAAIADASGWGTAGAAIGGAAAGFVVGGFIGSR